MLEETLVELKRSELNFLPPPETKTVKKSKPPREKAVQDIGQDINGFIKLVNTYEPNGRDPFIIRAIYYRVIHALISII